MTIAQLIGKRCLLKLGSGDAFRRSAVDEYRVLEVSPSGNWVKLMLVVHGRKFWVPVTEVSFVEELIQVQPEPPPRLPKEEAS